VPVIALGRLPERGVGRAQMGAGDTEVATLAARIPHFLPDYTFVDTRFVPPIQPWRPTPPVRPAGRKLLDLLGRIVPPDFVIGAGEQSDGLTFQHRRTADADIYFVTNLQPKAIETRISVRAAAPSVEWWDPVTGTTAVAAAAVSKRGRTEVPVSLSAWQSGFLVLHHDAAAAERLAPPASPAKNFAAVPGPWRFRAGNHTETLSTLESWTRRGSPLETFSGSADYTCTLDIPASRRGRLVLDLGSVGCVAEVFVNGQSCGVAWMNPWRVEITKASRPGANELRVRVTNLRIHEIQALDTPPPVPPELRARYGNERPDYPNTRAFMKRVGKVADLPPSGLLGPVRLILEDEA
jgi:hypothetical protein